MGTTSRLDYQSATVIREMKNIYYHEELVNASVTFTDKIKPIKLPSINSCDDYVGASGLGWISADGTKNLLHLQYAKLQVISVEECRKTYGQIVHSTTMCAKGLKNDTCYHDFGW